MKKIVTTCGIALGIAIISGCAAIEDRIEYSKQEQNASVCNDYMVAYQTYQELAAKELDNRKEAEKAGQNFADGELSSTAHMAWLLRSAELVAGSSINDRALEVLKERDKILSEALANYQYFHVTTHRDSYGRTEDPVHDRLERAKGEIASALPAAEVEQSRREQAKAAEKAAKAAKEAAKAALEKNLKDPAFLYPNRNICASSVKLYKDWQSGVNRIAILNKEVVNKDLPSGDRIEILNLKAVDKPDKLKFNGAPIFSVSDRTEMTGIKGDLTYVYGCESEKEGARAALIGVLIEPDDKTMTNDFIQKYRREMPNAKITQYSKEVSKRNFKNWFERSVIEHVTVFQDGAKVVKVIRAETKTTYSKVFTTLSKNRQDSLKQQYYEEEKGEISMALSKAFGLGAYEPSFFKSQNYICSVYIYDEMQLNAYAKIRNASDKEAAAEKAKDTQKKLDF